MRFYATKDTELTLLLSCHIMFSKDKVYDMTGLRFCPVRYRVAPHQLNIAEPHSFSGAIWVQFPSKSWNIWK